MYFDSHAHYDDARFDEDRETLLGGALQAGGVALVMNVGCDLTTSMKSVGLAAKYEYVWAVVGCHPHEAKGMKEPDLRLYASLFQNPKVRALGEIGLDYHYDLSPREVQRDVFVRQLDLAAELGVPVVIHEREAHGDCMDILRRYRGRVCGEFHCFSGSLEMAKELVKGGWYLGFNGSITFKNARRALEVLEWCPEERILLETDCPYLTPEPHRGERNDSRMLALVADKIAAIRGTTAEAVASFTKQNGLRFFGMENLVKEGL